MITPGTVPGAAFGDRSDGDARTDLAARHRMAAELGISDAWATMHQVHGATVATATGADHVGDADAMVTTVAGLPLVVATADCVPIVLRGAHSVAVVHAGWRGVARGVVAAARERLAATGDPATRAVIGPHIGPCCYEVGDEVVAAVGHRTTTRWGTTSVDLGAAVAEQLDGVATELVGGCTHHHDRYASYRRDGTPERQVTVAWVT